MTSTSYGINMDDNMAVISSLLQSNFHLEIVALIKIILSMEAGGFHSNWILGRG